MPISRICTIPDCGKPLYAKGYCNNHYCVWRRHGDPLAGRTKPGVIDKFFREVVLTHNSDECLIWPYAKSAFGHGKIWRDGKLHTAHRLLCIEFHGEPPTPEHEAAHNCGIASCCNWRHIRWATHTENKADELIHGTRCRGEAHGHAKLTPAKVLRIRELAATSRFSQKEISEMFDIGQMQVCRIVNRTRWKHI